MREKRRKKSENAFDWFSIKIQLSHALDFFFAPFCVFEDFSHRNFQFSLSQADDKSLLARFYHADRGLTAVANELDSFDGRSEPERCSRLVSKLRQEQVRLTTDH